MINPPPRPSASSSIGAASVGGSNFSGANLLLFSKLILQKVLTPLTSSDEDTSSYGIVTLLKDILIGTFFGVLTISFLIFFDHINLIHLQLAHNFRETAFSLVNDPETLATLEESAGLKFLSVPEYEMMMKEIEDSKSKAERVKVTIQERLKEAEEKQKELGPLTEEYDKLVKESSLGLDNFCADCSWQGRTSCSARKGYLMETYGIGDIEATVGAMTAPQCVKCD
ncbi:hypothetical protein HJC23_008212 [Cyclotella cryptica]|uniref:Uncharacterized protein n=1 Tax=Cyclotella cryptica TaxID=29204 RepID=A0ABD3NJM3_9STRA